MPFREMVNLISTDLFSLILLVFVLFRLMVSFDRMDQPLRLFMAMLTITCIMLSLDIAMRLIDGRPGNQAALTGIMVAYYSIQPLAPFLWLLYCLEHQPGLRMPFPRRVIILVLPIAVHTVLVIASLATAWFFSIDQSGTYHRGPGLPVSAGLPFFYIGLAMAATLAGGRSIPKRIRSTMLGFAVLPFLAALAQTLVYGVSLIWPAIALSLMMIYLGVEGDLLAIDYLTGLQNRRSLNRYLQRRLRDYQPSRPFGALMLDIDQFKNINDTFGHQAGDQALQEFAHLLRSCFHHQDFIARYAGDEFVVLLELSDPASLQAARDRLAEMVRRNNQQARRGWNLDVSIGALVYAPSNLPDSDEMAIFLGAVDEAMYREKRRKCGEAHTMQPPGEDTDRPLPDTVAH